MNIQETYDSVKLFNTIAGNLSNVTVESVDDQNSFVFEEVTEMIDGVEQENPTELLDGAVDSFVTVVGQLQKLEAAGFNVQEALSRVCANNLSKFPLATESVQYDESFTLSLNIEYGRYVIKDENSKIRKPSNFVPVDLSDLVNKDFFNTKE